MHIQWYPGHMTKTRRMMEENISLVDIVIELVDARIPYSSKNPDLDQLARNKHRIILLNKSDLADEKSTEIWSKYFESQGFVVLQVNSLKGVGLSKITDIATGLMAEKIERLKKKGRINVPVRSMIVGIPNVGKSTFINKYVGKNTAKTGDKPGITRGKQWIKLKKNFELLDTPGILWPKFEDQEVGMKLAFTGAINDDILDAETLAVNFIDHLIKIEKISGFEKRYELKMEDGDDGHSLLLKMAIARGFKIKGDEPDISRASKILMDEYRGGKLGRLTIELPHHIDNMNVQKEIKSKEKYLAVKQRKENYKNK